MRKQKPFCVDPKPSVKKVSVDAQREKVSVDAVCVGEKKFRSLPLFEIRLDC